MVGQARCRFIEDQDLCPEGQCFDDLHDVLLQGSQGFDRDSNVVVGEAELMREFKDPGAHFFFVENAGYPVPAGDEFAAEEDVLHGGEIRGK